MVPVLEPGVESRVSADGEDAVRAVVLRWMVEREVLR